MDPNIRLSKKAPPLPKFTTNKQQTKDPQLQKKLNNFFSSIQIQKQSKQAQQNKKQSQGQGQGQINSQSQVIKKQVSAFVAKQELKLQTPIAADKKKISLASINSKLNNMLNSKKISLNKAPQYKPKTTQQINPQKKQVKKRNQLQVEYDPNQPNNYDLGISHYLQKLQKLNETSSDEEDQQKRQNKIGYNHGLRIKQMIDEADQQMQVQDKYEQKQEEELQQRQQLALRMMQKHGYKVGEGLGKQSQGIKTPLTIKKTTDSSCTIQQSSISLQQMIRPQTSARNALIANNVAITQVVVFVDLVTVSELNDQVQNDLKRQCQNFGKIINYIAFMMKDQGKNPQLRIFIQFGTKEEAFSLFVKLNNKFYNQKLASIRFYSRQSFGRMQLNLTVHQHIQT